MSLCCPENGCGQRSCVSPSWPEVLGHQARASSQSRRSTQLISSKGHIWMLGAPRATVHSIHHRTNICVLEHTPYFKSCKFGSQHLPHVQAGKLRSMKVKVLKAPYSVPYSGTESEQGSVCLGRALSTNPWGPPHRYLLGTSLTTSTLTCASHCGKVYYDHYKINGGAWEYAYFMRTNLTVLSFF